MRKKPIKNYIRTHRLKRGFSQREVATLLGHKGQALVSHWEKGTKIPTLENFFRLAAILKIFPAEMLYKELLDQIRDEILQRKKRLNIWEEYRYPR